MNITKEKTNTKYPYSVKVSAPSHNKWGWCTRNLQSGSWEEKYIFNPRYDSIFCFMNESDATAFALMFKE